MSQQTNNRLVWIDVEMTGLDIDKCTILEVACIITDTNLRPLDGGLDLVIHQPPQVLKCMESWSAQHHEASGLTAASRASKLSMKQAEKYLCSYVNKFCTPQTCPIAGNSVHQDRLFLLKFMPHLLRLLSYRLIDVSTLSQLAWRWAPDIYAAKPPKKGRHRALDDIVDSIQELAFYRHNLLSTKIEQRI